MAAIPTANDIRVAETTEIKITLNKVTDFSNDPCPSQVFEVLSKLYTFLVNFTKTDLHGKVVNWPVCAPTGGRLNVVQLKAEIDKICLLCGPPLCSPPLLPEHQNRRCVLKAVYILSNYMNGTQLVHQNLFADSSDAELTCQQVKQWMEMWHVVDPQLSQLLKDVAARWYKIPANLPPLSPF